MAGQEPTGRADISPRVRRTMHACDAYRAMRVDRAHAPARTREEAVAELIGCGGSQFDPRVVDVLCDVIRDRGEAALRDTQVERPQDVARHS